MAAPTRGVRVELDRTRHIRYSLGTMADLEDKFGSLEDVEGIRDTIHVIWSGLKHEDPDLTREEVAEMVDGENLETVMEAVAEAFGQDPEEAKEAGRKALGVPGMAEDGPTGMIATGEDSDSVTVPESGSEEEPAGNGAAAT